jgi:hypothetical protein
MCEGTGKHSNKLIPNLPRFQTTPTLSPSRVYRQGAIKKGFQR